MFQHLNLNNLWPNFRLNGLFNEGGVLRLATRPGPLKAGETSRPGIPFDNAGFSGPASISIDAEGNVYLPDPDRHQVLRWRACDEMVERVGCFGGDGSLPSQFRSPHAVLVGPRGALYVADSGNHRIQIFDLQTLQLRSIWGRMDAQGRPIASHEVGNFNQPWALCADSNSFVYVVDRGNRRVQKFSADGQVVSGFWKRLGNEAVVPRQPEYIATILIDSDERLLISDHTSSRLLVYQLDGAFDEQNTKRWSKLTQNLPGGLVFILERDCIGGPEARHGLVFGEDAEFIGTVENVGNGSARLVLDQRARLFVQTSSAVTTSLALGHSYRESGYFLAGPFFSDGLPARWQRVSASVQTLSQNAHIQFFTLTSDDRSAPDWPPAKSVTSTAAVGTSIWRAAPMDALDFLIIHQPATFLWIGGVLQGDGLNSPAISQIRLEHEHEGWLRYLPAIYRRSDASGTILERSLAAFESLLAGVQWEIDDIPRLFDAWAAPDQTLSSWLDWLSTWVAFDLDESWQPIQRRRALAGAFDLLGRRGTIQGLKEFISLYVGADPVIEEASRHASVWALSEPSSRTDLMTSQEMQEDEMPTGGSLGFSTMLAAAQPDGAVLGTTAFIDGSHLISATDYGAPLFEDLAHRFCVHVRASEVSAPGAMEALRRVIDREKPAHTSYEICVAEPLMRVGVQARLGIDAIVGGPSRGLVLNEELELGVDTSLAAPKGSSRTIGSSTRVGVGTRLV